MNYAFKMSNIDISEFLTSVSTILEKRTELSSREKFSKLWECTDKLNENKIQDGKKNNLLKNRIWGTICLVLGIFILIPGLINPRELPVPLIVGICAVIIGLRAILSCGKNPFDKSAKILLEKENSFLKDGIVTVAFLEEKMEIASIVLKNGEMKKEEVLYTDFERCFDYENILVFVYGDNIIAIKKSDLIQGDIEEFTKFIVTKVAYYKLMSQQ